jgi:hypothetical protein
LIKGPIPFQETATMRAASVLATASLPFLLLAACNQRPAEDGATLGSVNPAAEATAAATLTSLQQPQIAASPLAGELGCTFTVPDRVDGPPALLLVAKGNVADRDGRAEALAAIAGTAVALVASETGGFDGMPRGAMFEGGGYTLQVTPTPGRAPLRGQESPPVVADLELRAPDGTIEIHRGDWTCGP